MKFAQEAYVNRQQCTLAILCSVHFRFNPVLKRLDLKSLYRKAGLEAPPSLSTVMNVLIEKNIITKQGVGQYCRGGVQVIRYCSLKSRDPSDSFGFRLFRIYHFVPDEQHDLGNLAVQMTDACTRYPASSSSS